MKPPSFVVTSKGEEINLSSNSSHLICEVKVSATASTQIQVLVSSWFEKSDVIIALFVFFYF